jgi:hypothetical protein
MWGDFAVGQFDRKQDSSAPIEKDSSAPRHFSTVEKK